jgi:carnosine N-methyltransferase
VAGDFEEIYGILDEDDERELQQGKWDAVLTCFFIDTVSLTNPNIERPPPADLTFL